MAEIKERALGAVPNLPDNRDIALASFTVAAAHPKKNISDISKLAVEDQKSNGSCVGQAEGKGNEYRELKETGSTKRLSKRFIYKRCKDQDGLKEEGTYPRVAATVLKDEGQPSCELVPDNNDLPHDQYIAFDITPEIRTDASGKRTKGYAFCYTLEDVKTAIDREGLMNGSMQVGDWNKLPVKPKLANGNSRGWHRVLWYGYEDAKNGKKDDTKIYFRNSWGINWARATRAADKKLQKEGNGWFWWSEYEAFVRDMMVYTDMPNEVIDYAKQTEYLFARELDLKDRGPDVTELQKRLHKETAKDGQPCFRYPNAGNPEFTAYFGVNTEDAVKRYQCAKGIVCSGDPKTTGYGRVGPSTLKSLNGGGAPTLGLYPLVEKVKGQLVAIMAAAGHPIVVTDEYRTFAEQDALYAKGRTAPGAIVTNAKAGESLHNWQVAFDVAFKKGAGISYEGPWEMLGQIGEALGLEWGGWPDRAITGQAEIYVRETGQEPPDGWPGFQDRPHFQMTLDYELADFQAERIDKSRFGVVISKTERATNNKPIMKRVKSFFMIFASYAVVAFVAVQGTVEYADFLQWIRDSLASLGVPAALIGFGGAFLAQLFFAWRNSVNARKWEEGELPASATAVSHSGRELGPDFY